MSKEALLLLFKNEVCVRSDQVDPTDDYDWYSLCVGFCIAKGADPDLAAEVATAARYTHNY